MGADIFESAGGMKVFKGLRYGIDPVAVKVLKGKHSDERSRQAFIHEIKLLRSARHPHIVQYLGACVLGGHILLVRSLYLHCNAQKQ